MQEITWCLCRAAENLKCDFVVVSLCWSRRFDGNIENARSSTNFRPENQLIIIYGSFIMLSIVHCNSYVHNCSMLLMPTRHCFSFINLSLVSVRLLALCDSLPLVIVVIILHGFSAFVWSLSLGDFVAFEFQSLISAPEKHLSFCVNAHGLCVVCYVFPVKFIKSIVMHNSQSYFKYSVGSSK